MLYVPLSRDYVSVKSFGATGDGTTDDSAAFTAAWAALKATVNVTRNAVPYKLVIPPGTYKISTPVNWTGGASTFLAWNAVIEADGAVILGNTTGKAVFDITGVRGLHLKGMHVYGDPTNTPTCAWQIGNISSTTCGNNTFSDLSTGGSFSKAACINFGSETTLWHFCYFINEIASASAYAFIADGAMRNGVTSDYATVRSSGTWVSFTNNRFQGCRFQKNTDGSAFWLEGSIGWQFDSDCYFLAFDDAGMVIRQSAAIRNSNLRIAGLFETTQGSGLDYVIKFIQPDTESSAIAGFTLDAATPHASTSIIRLARESDETDMTSGLMSFRQAKMTVQGPFTGVTPVLFSGPKMDWRGDIICGDATMVNLGVLNEFHGTLYTDDWSTIVSLPSSKSSYVVHDKYGIAGVPFPVANSSVISTVTGTTTETALATVSIPGGMMGANGSLRIRAIFSHTGSTNVKTFRVRVNSTAGNSLGAITSSAAGTTVTHAEWEMMNRNSASSQFAFSLGNRASDLLQSLLATSAGVGQNTANDFDLLLTGTLANSGETATLEYYRIDLVRRK